MATIEEVRDEEFQRLREEFKKYAWQLNNEIGFELFSNDDGVIEEGIDYFDEGCYDEGWYERVIELFQIVKELIEEIRRLKSI